MAVSREIERSLEVVLDEFAVVIALRDLPLDGGQLAVQQRITERRLPEVYTPCPDKSTARVEWDKFYLRKLIEEIDPKYNPVNFMAETLSTVDEALAHFKSRDEAIALKPRNLTGGKGVKVQGKQFETYQEAWVYAKEILAAPNQTGIEIQQKLKGHEFTLQLFTDGETVIEPPVTYDYPYREDGDRGPGTGGMGTFTMPAGEHLPFVSQEDYDEAIGLSSQLLAALKDRGHDYKGVLYPTFFKTPDGLKIVEVNARGGDPELINILDLMEDDVDFGEVLKQIARGELAADSIRYQKLASAMIYLVSPDYGYQKGPSYEFGMNPKFVESTGCNIRFAAAEKVNFNRYRTVGSSRTIGLSALGTTPWQARGNIHKAIELGFEYPLPLEYRAQVAEEAYIRNLTWPVGSH